MTGTQTMADFNFTPEHRAYFDELCLAVKDAQDNPDHWSQRYWHCNTSHCIAGFADMRRNGLPPQDQCSPGMENDSVFARHYPYWGEDAEIFNTDIISIDVILDILEHIRTEGFEYSREGYNTEGYDREGYDRKGYNTEGYDREGYDRKGYNTKGFDREGYDRMGWRWH